MICPHCSSMYTKKDGKRKRKYGIAQKYKCKSCTKNFSIPLDTEVKEYDPTIQPGEVLTYSSNKVVRVHCLTDIHLGAREFDVRKFSDAVTTIAKDPHSVWFGNGDMIEMIPPGYKAISGRGQIQPPEDQYLSFLQAVSPIKDKCLFVRGGNHDFLRSYVILDFDVCKTLSAELNVPYYQYPGYTRISVKGKDYYLVSGHGKSGAKNGDLELDRLASIYSDGDVFVLGHNHQLYAKPVDSIRVEGDEESLKRRWYVRGGSFLRYAAYARYAVYPVIRTGWVTMEFSDEGIRCWEN